LMTVYFVWTRIAPPSMHFESIYITYKKNKKKK
jgi:hypothetical protein